jgi:hypothetical protein
MQKIRHPDFGHDLEKTNATSAVRAACEAISEDTVLASGNQGAGKHPEHKGETYDGPELCGRGRDCNFYHTPGEYERRDFGPEDNATPNDYDGFVY